MTTTTIKTSTSITTIIRDAAGRLISRNVVRRPSAPHPSLLAA